MEENKEEQQKNENSESVEFFQDNNQPEMQVVNVGLNSKTGGISFTALVIIYCIFSVVASAVTAIIANSIMSKYGYSELSEALKHIQKTDAFIYINYLLTPIMIAICVLFITKRNKIGFEQIFPIKCKPKYYLISVLLIFGLLFSLSNLNGVSVEFFKLFGYKPRESSSYFPNMSGGLVVPAFIVIAILPAIFEELMFRGLLLNCCQNGMGSIRAILVTGFCFSLFHGSPEQTVYQFIAGCAFAFIAVRSGSILPSMLMHFINNALIVILNACNLFDTAGNLVMSNTAFIILTVFSAISFVGAVVWLVLDKTPLKKCEKGGVKVFFLYASVAIGALGLVWLLSLFGVS
ncbi:MAG: CPBP family intramembrane metalloprotease [Clostridia bacterium]|nr:CPBP family intramembrane metalloprotease [Clostridia bacterium]